MSNTVKRRSGYSTIPNSMASDTSMSIEARGLLALLMTMSEGWVFRSANLMKQCGVGREKYQRMIREIKQAGYLTIDPHQKDDGRIGHEWTVLDKPPQPAFPPSVNPPCGKPAPLRKNNKKRENKYKPPSGVWGERDENVLEMPKQRKKPRHSLPDDWVPDLEKAKALSDEYNLGRDEMNFCYQQMKGHAHATDRKLVNWDQGFANWIRKAVQSREVGPKSRKAGNQDFADRFKGI